MTQQVAQDGDEYVESLVRECVDGIQKQVNELGVRLLVGRGLRKGQRTQQSRVVAERIALGEQCPQVMGVVQALQVQAGRDVPANEVAEVNEAPGLERVRELDEAQVAVSAAKGAAKGAACVWAVRVEHDPAAAHVVWGGGDGLGRGVDDVTGRL